MCPAFIIWDKNGLRLIFGPALDSWFLKIAEEVRGIPVVAPASLQAQSQRLHVISIHRRPTPGYGGAAPLGGPSKQDGTQIEGVRKSVSGVKKNTKRGSQFSMSSPADTVRFCGLKQVNFFSQTALRGVSRWQHNRTSSK